MLDPLRDTDSQNISVGQMESAMWLWSQERFFQSSPHPEMRRFSFDVPLPAKVEDTEVAQRRSPECDNVVMAHTVPMLAGQPMVIGWYVAMAEALKAGDEERVWKLFEPALSVPIRLRLCPDEDTCQLAGLGFAALMFAGASASGADSFWLFSEKATKLTCAAKALVDQVSIPKLREAIGQYGLTFKSKSLTSFRKPNDNIYDF